MWFYAKVFAESMRVLISIYSLGCRGTGRLLLAIAFLFFLISSEPHRVHHFFEESQLTKAKNVNSDDRQNSTHEAAGQDHNRVPQAPARNSGECAVLSLAQNAHGFTAPVIALPFQTVACAHAADLTVFSTVSFNPCPFSQRAPPLA
jgi:hypothetical protein